MHSSRGVMPPKDTSDLFAVEAPATKPAPPTDPADAPDPRRLEQRRKQIDMGKNTRGYAAYTAAVPRDKRRALHGGLVPVDPMTPDIHAACSKRAFDGQVRKWRRMLHAWDPEEGGAALPTALLGGGGAEEEEGGGEAAEAEAEEAVAAGASPGTKRGAPSARTPATAGRRKQGRTQAGGRGGGGGAAAGDAGVATPAAQAAAAGGAGGAGIFADFEETEDWTLVAKPPTE